MSWAALVSSPLLAVGPLRTTFQWGRIHSPEDWLLPAAAAALVAVYVLRLYRRDALELRRPIAWLLVTLRTLTWAGLFLVWLQPQWRNEEDVVTPSRVVVLVDTSLSMAESAGEETAAPGGVPVAEGIRAGSRSAEAVRLLTATPLLDEIRRTHEVHIAGFDGPELRRVAVLDRVRDETRNSELGIRNDGDPALSELQIPNSELDRAALAPQGAETRIGETLDQAFFDHRAAPLSGVVIVTDGGQNTGLDPLDAVARAVADKIPLPPVLAVGLGSTEPVRNVKIQDLVAPPRTYPTDQFNITAFVQAQGMAGRTVSLEMQWREARPSGEIDPDAPLLDKQTKSIPLPADGKPLSVEFTLKPTKVGRTTVTVAIANRPADDRNPADDSLDADVEVTERRNRVLLFAAAATREYQFLRNQLQRIVRADGTKDKEFVVDVFLQTGSDGVSQDSSEILPAFPDTPELMFDYDCVVAFDPDWRKLSVAQQNLLREWIEAKAGGMIVVAGRINTDDLARDPNLSLVRGLYPVEFGRMFTSLADPLAAADVAWNVSLTPDGRKSEFLRLDDSDATAYAAWDEFEGFYDYFDVKGAKDKAVVLASLVDPRAKQVAAASRAGDDARRFLMVEHPVGAGRVLYLAGGELWRLRKLNPQYFTRLYTQLVRHVAQARLLRGSKRGVLMVDHDNGRYALNDVVEVRAQLMDSSAKPYAQPYVELQALAPDRSQDTVRLEADPQLPGNYRGLFAVRQVGAYRLDLQMPDGDRELLTRRLQVRVPNKESDDVRLDAALLERLAAATSGAYYPGVEAALGKVQGTPALVERLVDKTRTTTRLAKPVSLWDNPWTIAVLVALLGLEWLIRRLVRLA